MRYADCHPERKHSAKGLCLECYGRDVAIPRARAHYQANKARHKLASEAWRKQNPELVKCYRRTWDRGNAAAHAASRKLWLDANPERRDRVRRTQALRAYGMTIADYDAMLEAQGGACKLCRRPPSGRRLSVDHCHSTGAVRGLLCNLCNMLMGFVDADRDFIARLEAHANARSNL